jgi:hypothetical protein
MIRGMKWEQWRAEIDLSLREAELSRDRREAMHMRELEVARSERSRDADGPYVERSIGWLARVAQAAAGWML